MSRRRHRWESWSTDRLLDLRFCDLGVEIDGTWVADCVQRLYDELEARDIQLRPHVWLSEDWFSPDGIPGIAIPFYLTHPRLMRLERHMMLEVEGGNRKECMKLLRHEAGHAIQHAYQVHRRRRWQELFGSSTQPYPDSYWPRPASKRYVQHLDAWYAQSHPAEDFAETFAEWLTPNSDWRRRYAGWSAMHKLEYVDRLMTELAGERPKLVRKSRPYAIGRLRKRLGEHYEEKRERYGATFSEAYDRDLFRLFAPPASGKGRETAAAFLRRHRREIRELVCEWTGEYQFTVDQVLKEMIRRCQELKLRTSRAERKLKLDLAVFLAVQTLHYLYRGPGWHAV